MLRDRGVIKWTAMMLPEHIEQLKEWEINLQKDPPPAPLTEWEVEEIQRTIDWAYQGAMRVTFTLFSNHRWHNMSGFIHKIDHHAALLFIKTEEETKSIPFHHIQGAEIDD